MRMKKDTCPDACHPAGVYDGAFERMPGTVIRSGNGGRREGSMLYRPDCTCGTWQYCTQGR